jgi:hypothetical protein
MDAATMDQAISEACDRIGIKSVTNDSKNARVQAKPVANMNAGTPPNGHVFLEFQPSSPDGT